MKSWTKTLSIRKRGGADFLLSSLSIKCISFFPFCLLLTLHSTHPSIEKIFKDLNYDEFTYHTKSSLGSLENEPETERIAELRAMTWTWYLPCVPEGSVLAFQLEKLWEKIDYYEHRALYALNTSASHCISWEQKLHSILFCILQLACYEHLNGRIREIKYWNGLWLSLKNRRGMLTW